MFCGKCGSQIPDNAAACLKCSVPTSGPTPGVPRVSQKSRSTYILLGAALGILGLPGIHNLYAGYVAKGSIQLSMTALSCWVLWIPALIWTIIEVCTVTRDSQGDLFRGVNLATVGTAAGGIVGEAISGAIFGNDP